MQHNSTTRAVNAAGVKTGSAALAPKRVHPGWIPMAGSLSSLLVIAVASLWAMFAEDAGRSPPERIGSNEPVVAGATGADDVPVTMITPRLPVATRAPEPVAAPAKAMSGEDLFAYASPSVVRLEIRSRNGLSAGTGFFVGPNGLLVTNYHVIEKMASVNSVKIEMKDGRDITLEKVIGTDRLNDLALLQTNGRGLKYLAVSGNRANRGSKVYAIGFPKDGSGLWGSIRSMSVHGGEVNSYGSRKGREGWVDILQIDAGLAPGSSGGPVLNTTGQVVGIAVGGIAAGHLLDSGRTVNHAIPAGKLLELMQKARK